MTRPQLSVAWIMSDGQIVKADSQQLPEDPFRYSAEAGESGLVTPPYDLDQLAQTLETNSLHRRAVKQKAADILGRGIVLRGKELPGEGQAQNSPEEEGRWGAFVEAVESDERSDEALKERLVHAHEDFESIGWAVVEVSRDRSGQLDGLWHVPAHTMRAHADGRRFAQKRAGKLVWFKRFGLEGTVDRERGGFSERVARIEKPGNELIIIRNYTPRSSFYGLPDHIPAMPALAGWRAQAEFNVKFFDRHAVPAMAVVIEGADITPELEQLITEHFEKIKGDPHRTLVLPVPGTAGDDAAAPKVRFEKLAADIKDASFRMYKQDNAIEICIAHGIPPYRVGWALMGSLGGATAEEMTQIYNDGIVQPRQETWEQRLTRALLGEKGLQINDWEIKANELDTRNELRDLAKATTLWELDVTTVDDNARFFGYDARGDDIGAMHRSDLLRLQAELGGGFAPAVLAKRQLTPEQADAWRSEVSELATLRKRVTALLPDPESVAA